MSGRRTKTSWACMHHRMEGSHPAAEKREYLQSRQIILDQNSFVVVRAIRGCSCIPAPESNTARTAEFGGYSAVSQWHRRRRTSAASESRAICKTLPGATSLRFLDGGWLVVGEYRRYYETPQQVRRTRTNTTMITIGPLLMSL